MSLDETTVLLIDDDPQIVDLYAEYLRDVGTVRTAHDGASGLEELDEAVDVVVLDRRMPGMSGDEVLEAIRDRGYQCPVVMVTAIDADFDITKMACHAYLTKPVSADQLREVVERARHLSERDVELQEYFAAVAKLRALEAGKSPEALRASEEYAELERRARELRERVELAEPFEPSDAFESSLQVSVACDRCGEEFDPERTGAMREHMRTVHGVDPS